MKTLVYYQDPGHGWLAVPHDVLAELGQSDADYSGYSYRDAENVYLEEDGDMSAFMVLWRDRHGIFPAMRESHTNQESWIRRLKRCSGVNWVSPFARAG